MQEMGLAAVYPGPNRSLRARKAAIYPYLLANVTAKRSQSYLGHRHHVYSLARRLDVPGGDLGLVLALCRELLTRSNHADRLRAGGRAASALASHTADL